MEVSQQVVTFDDIPALIEESDRRRDALRALWYDYDPVTGRGSLIPRTEVWWQGEEKHALPLWMLESIEDPATRSLLDLAAADRLPLGTVLAESGPGAVRTFLRMRERYDLEFYAHTHQKVRTKRQGLQPLTHNLPQRRLDALVYRQIQAGAPIRIVIVKARQWGGSTYAQGLLNWIQQCHKTYWNSVIVAKDKDQANHLRQMYKVFVAHDRSQAELKGYGSSQNILEDRQRNNIIGVGSTKNPAALAGYTMAMLHMSEVGLWESTEKHSGEELARSLMATLVHDKMTVSIAESTARGGGSFFHTLWQQTADPVNDYEGFFVPWFWINDYWTEIDDEEKKAVASTLNDYEKDLWLRGCCLEQVRWYRGALSNTAFGDHLHMMSEYPSTVEEAFQESARRVFLAQPVEAMRLRKRKPIHVGDLRGKETVGKAAFEDLRMIDTLHGALYVWRLPGDDYDGKIPGWWGIPWRYVIGVDYGGRTMEADWTVGTVIDRAPMLWGDPMEVVARYRCHRRSDVVAWETAQIGWWYEKALYVPEVNRHRWDRGDKERGVTPDWSITIFDQIADYYPNMYMRVSSDRADRRPSMLIGFHTNRTTKQQLVNALQIGMEDGSFFDPDVRACNEYDAYEYKDDDRMGAVEGRHDDIVMSTGVALWAATQHLTPVRWLDRREKPSFETPPSMAGF